MGHRVYFYVGSARIFEKAVGMGGRGGSSKRCTETSVDIVDGVRMFSTVLRFLRPCGFRLSESAPCPMRPPGIRGPLNSAMPNSRM